MQGGLPLGKPEDSALGRSPGRAPCIVRDCFTEWFMPSTRLPLGGWGVMRPGESCAQNKCWGTCGHPPSVPFSHLTSINLVPPQGGQRRGAGDQPYEDAGSAALSSKSTTGNVSHFCRPGGSWEFSLWGILTLISPGFETQSASQAGGFNCSPCHHALGSPS